ncbi:MAG: hypothetical protein EA412_07205 [Chitinophagaceae bacterium]|nr:MAG: hypothetical protein EA412_07205 [Chitinophagaceae bacterium]
MFYTRFFHRNSLACFLVLGFVIGFSQTLKAQFTITKEDHVIEIGAAFTNYYNYRFYADDETNFRKNRFRLKDAQLKIDGRHYHDFSYELQADFSGLALSEYDGENPFLMDAWVSYTGLPVDIKVGYQKVPFSRNSMVPFRRMPFFQRAEMNRGDVYYRRDLGVTLSRSMWRQRLRVYAGAYTGLGETGLAGDNDPSGKLEYVFRTDLSYPTRFRYREMDLNVSPLPMFSVGLNGRYTDKNVTAGSRYQLLNVDGEKYTYGADASFQYMGLNVQLEWLQIMAYPNQPTLLYNAETDFFRAGGYMAQASYFIKPIKSVFAVRYDELNPHDLIVGNTRKTISFAYNFLINGDDNLIRLQYWHRLEEEQTGLPWSEDQIRIGWVFNLY